MEGSLIAILLGMVLPVPISALKGLFTNKKTPRWLVYLLSLSVSVLTGYGIAVLTLGEALSFSQVIENAALVVTASQTVYNLLLKGTGVDEMTVEVGENFRDTVTTMWK